MKRYQLISKSSNNTLIVLYESNNFDFLYHAFQNWKKNYPNEYFAITCKVIDQI